MIKKTTDIQIQISLDENHIAEEIKWSAKDGDVFNKSCKAFMLYIWDNKEETIHMNLWTKKMPIENMKKFFYQIFISLGDVYQKATLDKIIAEEIYNFGRQFAEKVKLIKK